MISQTGATNSHGDWYAPWVRAAIGPAWARWEHSAYLSNYRRLLATQYDAPEAIRARQWEAVQGLVDHAFRRSPFWRTLFGEAGLKPDDVRTWDDFRHVPILTKDHLRYRGQELLTTDFRIADLHHHKTSGSNGRSVAVYVDDKAQQWRRACTLRSDEWSGWRFGERVAMVWGNPDYLRNGWRGRLRNTLLERASYLDTLSMNEDAMRRFALTQQRRRPTMMLGHAHSLYLFAQFVELNPKLAFYPRGIISTAMVLHDWQRELIERVFRAGVTNRYGCEEVSLIACQCDRRGGLHINCDNVYVEILGADGEPATPGEAGAVVVTDLTNRAMPLLRYKVGDMASLSREACACGRQLPLLERVEGREADFVTTADGRLISGISLTENFAVLIAGVAQIQIVQERLDQFCFRIVPDENFGAASREQIRQLVAERFGGDARFEIELVERIPQEPSGKYRFCISKVENPFTQSLQPVTS
ncbi:MAG: hypothetical protein K1X71_13945 [Pirellulales bacterium]|nr:hypothetical protein [Pirellulales bacterium]